MIVSGLEETYPCIHKSEILEYPRIADGIRSAIAAKALQGWRELAELKKTG